MFNRAENSVVFKSCLLNSINKFPGFDKSAIF